MLKYFAILILIGSFGIHQLLAQPEYLKRSTAVISPVKNELTSSTSDYLPLFGSGDKDANIVEGINRFGILKLEGEGESNTITFEREEIVAYVLSGTGILEYKEMTVPISKEDFFYIPIGVTFKFSNPRNNVLDIMIMGYPIPDSTVVQPVNELLIANANQVPLQILGQHGPTTRFQLLMGTTKSKRDRLAAAYQVNSLFIIDFDEHGTNIPHRHEREEEIYYILNGRGDMVAGETEEGGEIRYPAKQGDAFFITRGTLVGFYGGTNAGEPHARILAVRSKYPVKD